MTVEMPIKLIIPPLLFPGGGTIFEVVFLGLFNPARGYFGVIYRG
jgi:hypothetical protein